MNVIIYLMVIVAFLTASVREVTDPPVALSDADRAELVEAFDAGGSTGVRDWLERESAQRGVDLMGQIRHSAGLDAASFDASFDRVLGASTGGDDAASDLEIIGRFAYGEASPMTALGKGLFDMAKAAVLDVVLPLIGIMAFFLGLMKVAEEAGVMAYLARLLRPVMVFLFPDIPPDHPAMSAIIMNMAANAAGLGNAATPFGIKAMQEMERLNPVPGTATNAMCLFLAINTSAIALLPTGVIGIRAALGSSAPAAIMAPTLLATMTSTAAAIVAAKVLQRFTVVAPPDDPPADRPAPDDPAEAVDAPPAQADLPLWVSLLAIGGLFAGVPLLLVYGNAVGPWLVPVIVVTLLTFGFVRRVPVYEVFVEGAREGWDIGVRIVPYLVVILAAVGMLRGSGAIDVFTGLLGPVTSMVGFPPEALPMALVRPLSGSGALGVLMATLEQYGPDTYIGYVVSTMSGSTETTFYVLAVYFGSVGIQRTRHAIAAALTADVVGMSAAVAAVAAYFALNGL